MIATGYMRNIIQIDNNVQLWDWRYSIENSITQVECEEYSIE